MNQPSTAFVQVSNIINGKKYNNITNPRKSTSPTKIIQSAPLTKDKITSKGASARNKRPVKSKVKPMSDEEFDLLLKNLRKPIPPSKREKHKNMTTTPMTKSLRDEHMYTNVLLPKNKDNTTHNISMTSNNEYLTINHMHDGMGKRQSIDKLLKSNPDIWSVALSNELGRLAQGIRDIKGNNVLDFIYNTQKYQQIG